MTRALQLNPYESPQPGDPAIRESMAVGESESIRRLLSEILETQRAMLESQRESAQLAREAMQTQYRWRKYGFVWVLLPLLVMLPSLWFSYSRIRMVPTMPPRPTPRPVPLPVPITPVRPGPTP